MAESLGSEERRRDVALSRVGQDHHDPLALGLGPGRQIAGEHPALVAGIDVVTEKEAAQIGDAALDPFRGRTVGWLRR